MKNKAFTLAEILITLGIIGVVAAMTIPALSQIYKRKQATTRLKKTYSLLQQAIKLSEYDNGPAIGWDMKGQTKLPGSDDWDWDAKENNTNAFFNLYLAPYMKYTLINNGKFVNYDNKDKMLKAELLDGTQLFMHNGACYDIRVDVNGDKLPNQTGKDRFIFLLCTANSDGKYFCGNDNTTFCPFGVHKSPTRNDALENCKNNVVWCAGLLKFDNWEFKNDYPYKL